MRSSLREKHNALKIHFEEHPGRYEEELGKVYKNTLVMIKEYMMKARSKRKSLRDTEDDEKVAKLEAKETKLKFLKTEVKRTISHMDTIFSADISSKSDEDITKRKKELSDLEKTQLTIPRAIQEIIDCGESQNAIDVIKTMYEELLLNKDEYVSKIDAEASKRERSKNKKLLRLLH